MRTFLFILLSACAFGQTLKNLAVAGTAVTFNPGTSSVGTYHVEGRVDGIVASRTLLTQGTLSITTDGSVNIVAWQTGDGAPSGTFLFPQTSGHDIRYRFQRDPTYKRNILETWDGACGSHQFQQLPMTDSGNLTVNTTWSVGPNVASGFVRMYSGLDESQLCPQDAPTAQGDVFDFPWENGSGGTLVGRTGGTATIASPTYADSTHSYSPYSAIGGYFPARRVPGGFRAGAANTFTSAGVSFQYPGDNSGLSYLWSASACTAGTLNFSSTTTASSNLTASAAADCPVSLRLTDSQGNTTATLHIGFVNADSSGRVTYGTAEANGIIGEVQAYGMSNVLGGSGLPWGEATWSANADNLNAGITTAPPETAGTGTMSIPSGAPNTISGGVITASTYGAVAMVCASGCPSFDNTWIDRYIDLHTDCDANSTFACHSVFRVASVPNTTTLVTDSFSITEPASFISTAVNWGYITNSNFRPQWDRGTQSYDYNFYEAGTAIIRLYYATGLTAYQTEAAGFCTNWYRYGMDSGYSKSYIPRAAGMTFLLACANLTGYTPPPGMFAQVANAVSLYSINWADSGGTFSISPINPSANAAINLWDVREQSYLTDHTALIARYAGNHSVNQTTWCGYLANQLNRIWLPNLVTLSGTYAYWSENLTALNSSFVSAAHPPVTGNYGANGWRVSAFPLRSMIHAYQSLNDPSGCNNSALAVQLYKGDGTGAIEKVARFVQDYCIDQIGGLFYDCQYESLTQTTYSVTGTVAPTNGSGTVVGSGTAFTSALGSGGLGACNGTTYMSFGSGNELTQAAYVVTACADATHLTISPVWQGSTTSGLISFAAPQAQTSTCGSNASQAQYCGPDQFNGRSLAQFAPYGLAWLYAQGGTGATGYKKTALFLLNKIWGGPVLGAGSLGPVTGTAVYSRPGTIALTNAGTGVTGTNTAFLSQFSNGSTITVASGSTGLAWPSVGAAGVHTGVYTYYTSTIQTVNSNTSITLTSGYLGSTESNIGMFYGVADPQWQYADGGVNNFSEFLPQCAQSVPPPCNIGGAPVNFGKETGANTGANNNSGAISLLLSTPAPAAGFRISSSSRSASTVRQ